MDENETPRPEPITLGWVNINNPYDIKYPGELIGDGPNTYPPIKI